MENKTRANTEYTLEELGDSNYVVAKGEPDIRGWDLKDDQGNVLGEVKELLCDHKARKVRYLIVDLDTDELNSEDQTVLLPIGMTELHEAFDAVTIPGLLSRQVRALPPYQEGHVTKETEANIYQILAGDNLTQPNHSDYDPKNDDEIKHYGNRKAQNVIGFFHDADSALQVSRELQNQNYPQDTIEVALRKQPGVQNSYSPENYERFFFSLFSDRKDAEKHQDRMRDSQAMVVVHAYSPEKAAHAATVFNGFRQSGPGNSGFGLDIDVEQVDSPADQSSPSRPQNDSHTFPIIEEDVNIGKTEIESGRVQVQSHIVERPIEENVRLREERVRIERVPVDRPASDADFTTFQEGSIELKEYAEVPVVNKTAQVVEEITIGKDVEVHEETVHETSRKTEVEVEKKRPDHPGSPDNPVRPS